MPDAVIPITLFLVIGWIVKIVHDNKTARTLIERGSLDDSAKFFIDRMRHSHTASIKWGLVLIGIGLAIIIVRLLPYRYEAADEIRFSLIFIFAGAALLIYYFTAGKKHDKEQRELLQAVKRKEDEKLKNSE